jgi:hypothetical protein
MQIFIYFIVLEIKENNKRRRRKNLGIKETSFEKGVENIYTLEIFFI